LWYYSEPAHRRQPCPPHLSRISLHFGCNISQTMAFSEASHDRPADVVIYESRCMDSVQSNAILLTGCGGGMYGALLRNVACTFASANVCRGGPMSGCPSDRLSPGFRGPIASQNTGSMIATTCALAASGGLFSQYLSRLCTVHKTETAHLCHLVPQTKRRWAGSSRCCTLHRW